MAVIGLAEGCGVIEPAGIAASLDRVVCLVERRPSQPSSGRESSPSASLGSNQVDLGGIAPAGVGNGEEVTAGSTGWSAKAAAILAGIHTRRKTRPAHGFLRRSRSSGRSSRPRCRAGGRAPSGTGSRRPARPPDRRSSAGARSEREPVPPSRHDRARTGRGRDGRAGASEDARRRKSPLERGKEFIGGASAQGRAPPGCSRGFAFRPRERRRRERSPRHLPRRFRPPPRNGDVRRRCRAFRAPAPLPASAAPASPSAIQTEWRTPSTSASSVGAPAATAAVASATAAIVPMRHHDRGRYGRRTASICRARSMTLAGRVSSCLRMRPSRQAATGAAPAIPV